MPVPLNRNIYWVIRFFVSHYQPLGESRAVSFPSCHSCRLPKDSENFESCLKMWMSSIPKTIRDGFGEAMGWEGDSQEFPERVYQELKQTSSIEERYEFLLRLVDGCRPWDSCLYTILLILIAASRNFHPSETSELVERLGLQKKSEKLIDQIVNESPYHSDCPNNIVTALFLLYHWRLGKEKLLEKVKEGISDINREDDEEGFLDEPHRPFSFHDFWYNLLSSEESEDLKRMVEDGWEYVYGVQRHYLS